MEHSPDKVSGAWVFRGTRVPVAAIFENLKDGASIDQFLDWFPGVTRAQVETLLDYVQELLKADSAANLSATYLEGPVEVAYISEPTPPTLTLAERRAFLKQPLAERQRLLAAQATELQDHYHQTTDWQDLMAGDIIEY